MRLFLAAYSKTGYKLAPTIDLEEIIRVGERTLPFLGFAIAGEREAVAQQVWTSEAGNFHLVVWSNDADVAEYSTNPLILESEFGVFSASGFYHERGHLNPSGLAERLANAADPCLVLKCLGGAASSLLYDSRRRTLLVSTSLTGMPQVYLRETADVVLIGSRADQVAVLGTGSDEPRYDLRGMVSFCLHDFYNTHLQPFVGVRLIEPNRLLQLDGNRSRETDVDDTIEYWGLGEKEPQSADFDDLTEVLLQCLRFFKDRSIPLEILLSGGKDSRLVAAGLAHLGADFRTNTGGWEFNPDFVVGKRVAELLGAPKALRLIRQTESSDKLEIAFKRHMLNGILKTGALRISRPATPPGVGETIVEKGAEDLPRWKLSGTYGEIIRGGGASRDRPYAKELSANPSTSEVEGLLRGLMRGSADVIRENLFLEHCAAVDAWLAKYRSPSNPLAILEKYDFIVNQFRRAAPVLTLTEGGGEYMPLADAQLIRSIGQFTARMRTEHIGVFEMIRRLAPQLVDVPLADSRWGFEHDGPRPGDEAGYEVRTPPPFDHTSKALIYTYYTLPTDLRAHMEAEFTGELGNKLFAVVDHAKWARIWYSPASLSESTSYWMLNLYGAGLILDNQWLSFMRDTSAYEQRTTIRVDHPWARFHNWSFHAIATNRLHFKRGASEPSRRAFERYIANVRDVITRNAEALNIPAREVEAELGSIKMNLEGRQVSLLTLIDPATAFLTCLDPQPAPEDPHNLRREPDPGVGELIDRHHRLFFAAFGFDYGASGFAESQRSEGSDGKIAKGHDGYRNQTKVTGRVAGFLRRLSGRPFE